ncbi:GNAT family N-acetyltransferase [Xinfangfangia pollutisoli]|uniref:GNAT family N-acetyltransferase n=1 Tax=Xinfangfangia pollutisoli TaxID=2865960 RepID=UPI001CD64774|nr:GNAT family N-acetyltransferase [Xinfangfangia pollutisoli]
MNAQIPQSAEAQLLVRAARPEDLPEVHRMLIALAAHHGDAATITPARLAELCFETGEALVLVACLPGSPARDPVGYALVTRRHEMTSGRMLQEVTHLYVQPPFRGRGLARALIEAARALALAGAAQRLTIGADLRNQGAAETYRRMGLQELPAPGPRFAVTLA